MTNDEVTSKISNHETRITKLEVDGGRLDERLAALVRSTDSLKKVNYCFTLLMLLAILYMAIGRQGYKDVIGNPLIRSSDASQSCKPILDSNTTMEVLSNGK